MTPLEQINQALASLNALEHSALDEEGRGGFTDEEVQQSAKDIRTVLETIQAPLLAQEASPRPLKAYKPRQYVEVFDSVSGDWRQGYISDIDRVSGHLHVETERGPITIGTARRVRPQ